MNKHIKSTIALLLAGCIFSGCSGSGISMSRSSPDYSIGVVVKAINSPYWQDMQNGVSEAAKDLGVDVTFLYPSGEKQEEEQNIIVKDLLESDIDALLLAPCNCTNTEWIDEIAREKGILFLNIDDHSADVSLPYIGSDHVKMGEDSVAYFNEILPDGGNVYLLFGPANQRSCQDRLKGILKSIEKPLEIAGVSFTNMTEYGAYQAIMEADKKIDAVFCHNIVLAQGAMIALKEKGWDAKIIIVDTEESGSAAMKRGNVSAVLIQDGYKIGYQAIVSTVEGLKSGQDVADVKIVSNLLTPEGEREASE